MASRALRDYRRQRDESVDPERVRRDADLFEQKILARHTEGWNAATADIGPVLEDWDAAWQMYLGNFLPGGDREGPFDQLYVAKAAPAVDRLKATIGSSVIPDESSMDFFQGLAQPISGMDLPPPDLEKFGQLQQASIRRSLINGGFASVGRWNRADLCITGNWYALEGYEEETKVLFDEIPSPLYGLDPISLMQAPGGPYVMLDGAVVQISTMRVVPKATPQTKVIRAFADPKTMYLNPFNVFPSELDRNGLENCSGVYIYDAIDNPGDLVEDAVMADQFGNLSGNYANVTDEDDEDGDGGTIEDDAEPYLPAVWNNRGWGGGWDQGGGNNTPASRVVKRIGRQTYWGQYNIDELCEDVGFCRDSPHGAAVLDVLFDKFNVNRDRAAHMKTWVVESEGRYLPNKIIRWQPNPYNHDKIPVVQGRLITQTNQTLGMGIYQRAELPERIWNAFNRQKLDLSQKLSDPPSVVYTENIDPVQIQELGGIVQLTPGLVLRGINRGLNGPIVEPVNLPTQGIQFSEEAANSMAAMIDEQTMIPATAAGQLPGSDVKAKAIGLAAQGADAIIGELVNGYAADMMRLLQLKNEVQKQFCAEEPRRFVLNGPDGKPVQYDVPPEAMRCDMIWFAVGPNSVGNREAKTAAMDTATKVLAEGGRLDFAAYGAWLANTWHDANIAAMVAPPAGPEPVPARITMSLNANVTDLAPPVAMQVYKQLGIEVTPEMEAAQINSDRVAAGAPAIPAPPAPPGPPVAPRPVRQAEPMPQEQPDPAMAGAAA